MTTRTAKVPNISCGHCVRTIERELGGLTGVKSVEASEAERQVTVAWDEKVTDWDRLEAHLREINYPPVD